MVRNKLQISGRILNRLDENRGFRLARVRPFDLQCGHCFIVFWGACHLTALGPLSSCIYTTSSPSTLSRPYIYPYFTVTAIKTPPTVTKQRAACHSSKRCRLHIYRKGFGELDIIPRKILSSVSTSRLLSNK
jgi:hypothetical protein